MRLGDLIDDRDDIRRRLEGIDAVVEENVRRLIQGESADECYLAALAGSDFILAAAIARHCWHHVPTNSFAAHLWANRLRDCEYCSSYQKESQA